ncbi:disks large-associated protein 5 isoform X2 [Vanacampus margaritifer]
MEPQFSYLRRRDSSVTMLRVKMTRRQSQNQKENRKRVLDARRQLGNLQEDETSYLDASVATRTSTLNDLTNVKEKSAKDKAGEERLKQLARWKEKKALEKEKQKQQRDRKAVFKTGLYRPKDSVFAIPLVPVASTKAKATITNAAPSQSSRVTRSMAQQQHLKTHKSNMAAKKVEPVVRGASTRSANRPVAAAAAPAVKDQPKDTFADQRITRRQAVVSPMPRPSASQMNCTAKNEHDVHPLVFQDDVEPRSEEENAVADQGPVEPSSFAPEGFLFKAPAGVAAFNFAALTPRSADRFLAPGSAAGCLTPAHVNVRAAALFVDERQVEPRESSPPPLRAASPTPKSPFETKHDVAYFRSEMANETDRLTSLCAQWETRVDDKSIPEETIGLICTTVGQARLLMKERFKQFSGLVDDCDLRRGEKITTCSDLQGFWDMVYFQVEDVYRKFDSLKEAEARGWAEEHKPPPPRQRKAVKKPAAAPAKPPAFKTGKSGLAALKAAMRAQKKAAEAAKAAALAAGDATDDKPRPSPQRAQRRSDSVVFDGGFFRVESPAKTPGSVRRSSRLSAAAPPQASPRTNYPTTPRRVTRSSLALGQTAIAPSPLVAQAETAEDSLFVFTPNPRDRIRPSVCPNDLMSFTPPSCL